uniref:DNA binding protein n=1 Tax=Rhizophora mucronata TaxID=61149 RepID=A0A2P2IXA4_RHIMU
MPGAHIINPCNLQCNDQVYCLHPVVDGKSNEGSGAALNGQGLSACEFENMNCLANQNSVINELPSCGVGNLVANASSSGTNKEKGENL